MKSRTEYLTFRTKSHREYVNITDRVAEVVRASGIAEGMVIVPITRGALDLGPRQQIYYAGSDGQRPKRLVIKAMGE